MPDKGFGAVLTWNGTAVAKLTNVGGLGFTVSEIDDTTHDSPDGVDQSSPGRISYKEIPISGFFDKADTAGQHALFADGKARTKRAMSVTYPTGTGTSFSLASAWIKDCEVGVADIGGNIPFTASIKPDGGATLTVATVTGMSDIGFSNDVLIMPAFAIGTFEYVVTITAAEVSTIVTPTDASAGEIITITTDGAASQVVATGQPSTACVLDVDDVTEIVVTISHATKAPKKYTFHCAVLAP